MSAKAEDHMTNRQAAAVEIRKQLSPCFLPAGSQKCCIRQGLEKAHTALYEA